VTRICDLPPTVSTLRGKVEFEVSEEGREQEVLEHLLRRATADTFRAHLGKRDLSGLLATFDEGGSVETGDLVPGTDLLARVGEVPGLAKDHEAARHGRERVAGQRGGGGGVRAGGPVPDAPPVQGHGRRRGRLPHVTGPAAAPIARTRGKAT
jgi:Mg-chelatase subunit ChlI